MSIVVTRTIGIMAPAKTLTVHRDGVDFLLRDVTNDIEIEIPAEDAYRILSEILAFVQADRVERGEE